MVTFEPTPVVAKFSPMSVISKPPSVDRSSGAGSWTSVTCVRVREERDERKDRKQKRVNKK
jgi:hypothetical protein